MKKTLLGASFAAFFVITMIASGSLAFASGHLSITESEVEIDDDDIEVEIETAADVPLDGESGLFGYAVLTDGGSGALDNVLVLVTHLPLDDSSHEDPVSGFHTHVLDLKAPTGACPTGPGQLEVDLVGSGANTAFDADYDWEIDENELEIEDVSTSGAGTLTDTFVSFNLSVLGPLNNPDAVCVNDAQFFTGEIDDDDDDD